MNPEASHPEHQRVIEHLLDSAEPYMTHEELRYFRSELESHSLQELLEEYLPEWHQKLWARTPVPMLEWLYAPEHMNLKGQIFDRLASDLEEQFEGGYEEAIWEGAIGYGKSFVTSLSLTRMIYEVSCLQNPQLAFGLADRSTIAFVNVALKLGTAKEVVFQYVKNFVDRSEYFQEHFQLEKGLEKELVFPNNIRVYPGTSSQSSIIGQNVFGGILDECNFFERVQNSVRSHSAGEIYDHAEVLRNAMIRRMRSRFARQGKLPGMLLLASSTMYPDDFTARRYQEATANGEKVFYRRYSQWEPKPDHFFSKERFLVSLGNANTRPRLLRLPEEPLYEPHLDNPDMLEEDIQVISVPEDYRGSFEGDLEMAIRDEGGYPTQTASPFFRDTEPIRRAVARGEARGLEHPFGRLTTTLSDGATWLRHHLDFSKRHHNHFAHVDLALTGDAAGITIVRLDGSEARETTVDVDDGLSTRYVEGKTVEYVPMLTQVLSLRVVPPPEGQIPITKIRQLLIQMLDWGFLFGKISYDQYNSAESLQYLQNRGLEAEVLSVDRKMTPYEVLRSTFYDDRIDMYPFEFLFDELSQLEIDTKRKKIDHRPKGSKDVADTLAGSVYNATLWAQLNPSIFTPGEVGDVGPVLLIEQGLDVDDWGVDDTSWLLGPY